MRDLFQVVFELKKKEIEMAKQHIEQHQMKFSSPFPHAHLGPSNSSSNGSSSTLKVINILVMTTYFLSLIMYLLFR